MTINEAIEKIKVMLSADKKEKFAQATLVDGVTSVEADNFEVGEQLFVITTEGRMPAPEGTHETLDGLILSVDAAGVIVEITEAAAPEVVEEEMEEDKPEAKEEMEEPSADEIKEEIIADVVETIAPLLQEIADLRKEVEEFKAKFEKFSAAPAGKPVKNNFSETQDVDKRLEALKKLRKNNLKK